jgi:hypothetical protein
LNKPRRRPAKLADWPALPALPRAGDVLPLPVCRPRNGCRAPIHAAALSRAGLAPVPCRAGDVRLVSCRTLPRPAPPRPPIGKGSTFAAPPGAVPGPARGKGLPPPYPVRLADVARPVISPPAGLLSCIKLFAFAVDVPPAMPLSYPAILIPTMKTLAQLRNHPAVQEIIIESDYGRRLYWINLKPEYATDKGHGQQSGGETTLAGVALFLKDVRLVPVEKPADVAAPALIDHAAIIERKEKAVERAAGKLAHVRATYVPKVCDMTLTRALSAYDAAVTNLAKAKAAAGNQNV